MLDISAIVLTIVVAVLAVLLWRLVRAIERREAQFDRPDEQFNRRDQQFEQALREMHDLTAAVRKLVDVILTRWDTPRERRPNSCSVPKAVRVTSNALFQTGTRGERARRGGTPRCRCQEPMRRGVRRLRPVPR